MNLDRHIASKSQQFGPLNQYEFTRATIVLDMIGPLIRVMGYVPIPVHAIKGVSVAPLVQVLTPPIMELGLDRLSLTENHCLTTEEDAETKRCADLLLWLQENGCEISKLTFLHKRVDNRGVSLKAAVKKGATILTVSPACLITIDSAKNSPIGIRIRESGCRVDSHTYVAAFLLTEKQKGSNSFYAPYITTLPKTFPHMPVNFSSQELSLLQGSLVLREIESRQSEEKQEYADICLALPEFSRFSFEEFVWARLCVLSRIFGITIGQKKTSAMVPMADMLNHKKPPDTYWTYDNKLQAFVMTASLDLAGGLEIFDSYGPKANTDYLLNYGFVASYNIHNTAQFLCALDPSYPLFSLKQSVIGGNVLDREMFEAPVDYDTDQGKELFSFFRFAVATEAELIRIRRGEEIRVNVRRINPLNIFNELRALQEIGKAASDALANFSSSIEDDQALLADKSIQLSTNQRNCIFARNGEKSVLHHYIGI
jgi:histone-lysine N-methyltransferase SETD3